MELDEQRDKAEAAAGEAAELLQRLAALQRERDALLEVLERLPLGLLLLDASGAVLRSSNLQSLGTLRNGVQLGAQGLQANSPEAASALRSLLASALAASADGRRRSGAMSVSRGPGRRPLELAVLPLGPDDADGTGKPAAAVLFADPGAEPPLSLERCLAELHRLTRAEARIVRLLLEGKTLAQAAEARGISPHTARTHLRRTLHKLDARSQADLLRLLRGGLCWLRLE
jgi:DNA-binding CsgD family transcriptional regulator